MERFCRYVGSIIEALIVAAVFIVTLPLRILDRIVYSK